MIKCLTCVHCLDLGTLENPGKKTPITDCFCHKGHWDGSDFIGEDLNDWEWNDCKDFGEVKKKGGKSKPDYKNQDYFKNLPNEFKPEDFLNSPAFGADE